MEKISQKQIIINLLKETNDWMPSYKMILVSTQWGWLGSQAKRRAQELLVEGKIERKLVGKYVYYRAKQISPPVQVFKESYLQNQKLLKLF